MCNRWLWLISERIMRAEADWHRFARGRLCGNVSRASYGIWDAAAGVMVEVSDREQRWVACVLLLDLLCSRALHVVLVGASVIEPENRMSCTEISHRRERGELFGQKCWGQSKYFYRLLSAYNRIIYSLLTKIVYTHFSLLGFVIK